MRRSPRDRMSDPSTPAHYGKPLIGGQDPARELEAFASLRRCLLDSSSAIYMEKAGYLGFAGRTLDMQTIPQVITETGYHTMPVLVVRPSGDVGDAGEADARSTDAVLVDTATELKIPVITEDRKMMLKLDAVGIPFFNALMILHLLLFRGEIDLEGHRRYLSALLSVSRYSARVRVYGEQVFQAVLKYR